MGAHCTHAPVRLSWRRAAHAHGTTNRTEGEACHRPTRLNEKKVPSDFRPRPRGGLAVVHADAIATNGRGAEARLNSYGWNRALSSTRDEAPLARGLAVPDSLGSSTLNRIPVLPSDSHATHSNP